MHFRNGYAIRCTMEGKLHDWQFDRKEYWNWLTSRFQVRDADSIGEIGIISSFCANDVDAFYTYFTLLEEFLQLGHAPRHQENPAPKQKCFAEIVKSIRERPGMYLGSSTFFGCYSYLSGDERAYQDLQLPADNTRAVFDGFKQWVEIEKNRALPRPWFKVITFRSMGLDCGHVSGGAFSRFYDWLDEYAEKVVQPNIVSRPGPVERRAAFSRASSRYLVLVQTISRGATLFSLLISLPLGAIAQVDIYPHNSVACDRCHDAPIKFGGSQMTVQRTGVSFEGKFPLLSLPTPHRSRYARRLFANL